MDEEIIKKYKAAGKISFESLNLGEKLIQKGESVAKILDEVDNFIKKQGAVPAFPSQISINEFAAHFCPTNEDDINLNEGDVVKLDTGVCVDGFIADNARTIDLGSNRELVKASEEALNAALKLVRPGIEIRDIGKEIHDVITGYGFSPIRNLSGHGLDEYEVHATPTIPNFDTGDGTELEEDDVIAIEPFASTGAGIVYESSNPTLFSLSAERPVRSTFTREILKEIKSYKGLPFATRWLIKKFGLGKTSFALRELKTLDMLDSHPPLIDKAKGKVSQAEHSMIVKDKPIVYTKW